jgi:2,4-dichlorophenol 6-monooxygenase
MIRVDLDVLVVGGGPVGLMAALLLAGVGITSLVVERRDGPHRAPQAHVVNPRTLEICRALGVDMERIRAEATPAADGGLVVWMTTLAGEELGRLPYERQDPGVLEYTPTPLANLSQHRFEPILAERLRCEARSTVRYGHQWMAAETTAAGAVSRVRELASGTDYDVRSRYVLACDGAGSHVRRSRGIEMLGPEEIQRFVMIHFEANLRPLVRERPAILYWTMDPEALGAFVAHDIERTWVFMHPVVPGAGSPEAFDDGRCADIVRRAIGPADVDFTIRTISTWSMTAQVARRYRDGAVFLLGDAAHRFPPSGGMGMNTGLQDAHNLVWKLAAVEAGWGAARLLDTYEMERRPVAQENCDRSLENSFKMLEVIEALDLGDDPVAHRARMRATLRDPRGRARVHDAIRNQQDHFDMLALQLGFAYDAGAVVPDGTARPVGTNPVRDYVPTTRPGARLPHAWIERGGARISTLDLVSYDRFTLITGSEGRLWHEAARRAADARRVPIACLAIGEEPRDPRGEWAARCEIGAEGALLVRPDGHVAWRHPAAVTEPERVLGDVLDRLLASR